MENAIDLSGAAIWDGVTAVLKFGPLGLSALLLVLAVFVLTTKQLQPASERLMRQFIYVGAGLSVFFGVMAFLPSLVRPTEHALHLSVLPIDMGASSKFPPAILRVNNETIKPPLSLRVKEQVTAILDVSDAINYAQDIAVLSRVQQDAIGELAATNRAALTKVAQAADLAGRIRCPVTIGTGNANATARQIASLAGEAEASLQQVRRIADEAMSRGNEIILP